MHYTQRLKDLREDKELKQEAIAIVLKITRQHINFMKAEKGNCQLIY